MAKGANRDTEDVMDSSRMDTLSDDNQPAELAPNTTQDSVPKTPNKHFCRHCGIVQPYRSRHCKICQCCVAKFDHHCFWIGGCVGELNHGRFITMLGLMIPNYGYVAYWVKNTLDADMGN